MTAARDHEPGLDDLGPAALLDALATVDRRSRQAEADKLALAYQWAITHPATTQTGTSTWGGDSFLLTDESLGGDGCPGVEAFAAEPLAVTLEISPASARQLIADALDLRHRLPLCHAMVETLQVPAWKARMFTPDTPAYAGTSELHITGDTLGLTRLYQHACQQAAAAGEAGDPAPRGPESRSPLRTRQHPAGLS
ncbi:hypothetical protein [Nocardioides bigeumensis]|uniref:DUF222 domain-containing protein n=1 Tax=Nocardioides bigeumensis TaxID=433657 RepID=A0ABN2YJN8_9ACTN